MSLFVTHDVAILIGLTRHSCARILTRRYLLGPKIYKGHPLQLKEAIKNRYTHIHRLLINAKSVSSNTNRSGIQKHRQIQLRFSPRTVSIETKRVDV